MILLAVATLGVLIAIGSWLIEHDLISLAAVPCMFAAAVFWACRLLDRRIAEILEVAYERAAYLEAVIAHRSPPMPQPACYVYDEAFHRRLRDPIHRPPQALAGHPPRGSSTSILARGYIGLTALSTASGTAALAVGMATL